MEKRFTLALVLCLVFMFAYQWFLQRNAPPKPKPETDSAAKPVPDSPEKPSTTTEPPTTTTTTTQTAVKIDPQEIRKIELKNDVLKLVFTNVGAALSSAELLDFAPSAPENKEGGRRLLLLAESAENLHALRLEETLTRDARLGETLWPVVAAPDDRTIAFERIIERKERDIIHRVLLRKEFHLPAGASRHLKVRITGQFLGEPSNQNLQCDFRLLLTGGVFQEPDGSVMSPPRSSVSISTDEIAVVALAEVLKSSKSLDDVRDHLRGAGKPGIRKGLGGASRFAADLGNYIGAFLVLQEFPKSVVAAVHPIGQGDPPQVSQRDDLGDVTARTATVLEFQAELPQGGPSQVVAGGLLYLGPVDGKVIHAGLDSADKDAAATLTRVHRDQLGWARFIGNIVLWTLAKFHGLTGNWGWAIMLLTLCVRIVLFPINRRSQVALAKHSEAMARIKPRLEALKKKHEKDPKQFAQEQMKLMREEKVPIVPLGGCLPIFLQIPIFFGLFAALRASIDLRQAPWLWVADLSQPDHLHRFGSPWWNPLVYCGSCCGMPQSPTLTGIHLLPLLMTAAWVVNSWLSPKPATNDPQMEQQRKMMMFMPILFGLMMYNYAAGLSLYWLTSSLIGIVETRMIKKFWPVNKSTA